MKTLNTFIWLGTILLLGLGSAAALEQEESVINTRNLGGPRFGLTYVLGTSQLTEELDHHGMGRTISQFGWHFEHQVVPKGGGPQFLLEFVPMLAGVEYGKVIPNFTVAMGMRTPAGWEFGMGPNLTLSQTLEDDIVARTSLLLAVGKSFNYGGVSIPVNLAYTTSPQGDRMSLMFGYAIGSSSVETAPMEQVETSPVHDWSSP